MMDLRSHRAPLTQAWQSCLQGNDSPGVMYAAQQLYSRTRRQGWLRRLCAALTGKSSCLLDLDQVKAHCPVSDRHYVGARSVPIDQIRGSDGRCNDFDAAFCPLHNRTRNRWLSVAIARQAGKSLPPVDLIQVGGIYFVQDGHHRISVARAMGQKCIDAEVVEWHGAGPLL